MKKLLFILPLMVLLSCSVQKRKYQKGFYVSTLKHKKKEQIKGADANEEKTLASSINLKNTSLQTPSTNNEILSATTGDKIILLNSSSFQQIQNNPDSLCDRIVLKNGDESMVKVLEIAPNDVKYKKCDSPDGPLYVVKKADVFMIQYANGTKEVFKTESTPSSNQNQNTQTNTYKGPKKTHPLAIVALICGILGIWPLTGLASIFAIIFGNLALKKIRQSPDVYKGETMAQVGKIMGIVILSIIGIILLLAILIALLTI